jgi:hypothetical protein
VLIHSLVQRQRFRRISTIVHAFVTIIHFPLITQSTIWQFIRFI